jgi:hypothetical protein
VVSSELGIALLTALSFFSFLRLSAEPALYA